MFLFDFFLDQQTFLFQISLQQIDTRLLEHNHTMSCSCYSTQNIAARPRAADTTVVHRNRHNRDNGLDSFLKTEATEPRGPEPPAASRSILPADTRPSSAPKVLEEQRHRLPATRSWTPPPRHGRQRRRRGPRGRRRARRASPPGPGARASPRPRRSIQARRGR